ncbi:MAG: type II secretion system protein GspE, partial [Actinobacteria bacterium]
MSARNQLGTLLLERGLINQEQLDAALEEQRQSRKSLGRVLIDDGVVSESDLVATLAARIGLDFVDLNDYAIDPSAVGLISDTLARRFQAVPVGWEENRLVVAMADPSNVVAIDDIRTITGADVRTVVATRGAILETIERHHRMEGDVEDVSALAASEMEAEDDLSRVREVTEDAPIVKLVNLLISQAVQDRASDIHVEPAEHDVRVRYRIDGVLHEVMRSPKNIQAGL